MDGLAALHVRSIASPEASMATASSTTSATPVTYVVAKVLTGASSNGSAGTQASMRHTEAQAGGLRQGDAFRALLWAKSARGGGAFAGGSAQSDQGGGSHCCESKHNLGTT
jgi:hypothetical protein